MTSNDHIFIKRLQNTIWGAVGVLFLGMLTAGVGFYYRAGANIDELQRDVMSIDEKKVNKELYEATIQNISRQLGEINSKLDKK